jgi:hypothetical protein
MDTNIQIYQSTIFSGQDLNFCFGMERISGTVATASAIFTEAQNANKGAAITTPRLISPISIHKRDTQMEISGLEPQPSAGRREL